jgi:hypothetical protein
VASTSSKRTRYTPPSPKKRPPSPVWVPAMMGAAMLCGVAVVLMNYFEVLPGDHASNAYLFLGLGLITSGFLLATTYR